MSGEEDALAELRDAPGVGEPGQHLALPPRPSRASVSSACALPRPSAAAPRRGASVSLAAGFGFVCFLFFFGFGSFSSVTVPPAASIFSRAVAEIACAGRSASSPSSPLPRILTSVFVFLSRPTSTRLSGVTSAPRRSGRATPTLTGCGGRPERADRHRVLRRRAALLAEPHVDRHLAALEAGAHLVRARAGLLALDAAAGVAALARSPGRGRRACGPCAAARARGWRG